MKVLNIIAQKPDFTGSGVYLREIVKCFENEGNIKQGIICAISKNDVLDKISENVEMFHVLFDTNEIPFHVVGMSDNMPYKSTKYSELAKDKNKLSIWLNKFTEKIIDVNNKFNPDIIICHHLYLLMALTCSLIKNKIIIGISHNTDLRQFIKTDLMRDFILENVQKLNKIFAISEENKKMIKDILKCDENKIEVIGIGYNNKVFYDMNIRKKNNNIIEFMSVGKVSKKKGILSLMKSINIIKNDYKNVIKNKILNFNIIGGYGDENEYNEIVNESKKCIINSKEININIRFWGRIETNFLVEKYNESDIFIMPSFSEGIPMVAIEALACGMKVVISDLPGVKNFFTKHIKNAIIEYVTLPSLTNYDDATTIELSKYEKRLALGIVNCIKAKQNNKTSLYDISWENIAKKYINVWNKIIKS